MGMGFTQGTSRHFHSTNSMHHILNVHENNANLMQIFLQFNANLP